MSLLNEFREWQDKLLALQQEGEKLYTQFEELERQNAELRQRLANGDAGGGFDALNSRYEEGLHVCPESFGQSREDECIFCLKFLLHKGKK